MKPREVRRVELRAAPGGVGVPLDSIEIHWPWLLGPQGFDHEEVGQSVIRVWPRTATTGLSSRGFEGDQVPDAYFGSIPFVARRAGSADMSLIHLTYPPPAPFEVSGAQRMWDDVCAHGLGLPESVRAQGRFAGAGAPDGLGHHVDYVLWEEVQQAAAELLGSWPTRIRLRKVIRPVHQHAGVVDHVRTAAIAGVTVPIVDIRGREVPGSTARSIIKYEPWRFAAVGLVTEHLAGALVDMSRRTGGVLTPAAMYKFMEIASACRGARGSVDPPLSSWPRKVRRYYIVALAMLTELRAALAGGLPAPLCDFWRLYEEWVTVTSFRALREELGEPRIGPRRAASTGARVSSAWEAEWEGSHGASVHFLAKPRFDGSSRPVVATGPMRLRSVTSLLVPDALVGVRSEGGLRLNIVDAKKRTSASGVMAASDAAAEASKYLWGIRGEATDASAGVIARVDLLSSLPGVSMYESGLARIVVRQVLPVGAGVPAAVRSWAKEVVGGL